MIFWNKSFILFLVFCLYLAASFDDLKSDDAFPQTHPETTADRLKHSGQRGIASKRTQRRKQGDPFSQLKMKLQAREFVERLLERQNNSVFRKEMRLVLKRRKRYQYDEDYDWENGGLDYEDHLTPKKEETKFEKWAKNWQKNTLKFIFLFSFIMMILCCCCACCRKVCGKFKGNICFHIREWRDLCLCRDPTYRRMRHMADEYGFELDYSTYKKIKNNYEKGLENQGYGKFDLSGRT